MQAILIVAVLGAGFGYLVARLKAPWARISSLIAAMILPVALVLVVLATEECDRRLSSGLCNGAGITIMVALAVTPAWVLALVLGYWFSRRRTGARLNVR